MKTLRIRSVDKPRSCGMVVVFVNENSMSNLDAHQASLEGGVVDNSERPFDRVIIEIAESYAKAASNIDARSDELERLKAEAILEQEKIFQTFLTTFKECILRNRNQFVLIHPRLVGRAVSFTLIGSGVDLRDIDNRAICHITENIDYIYIPNNVGFKPEFFERELVKEVCKFIGAR